MCGRYARTRGANELSQLFESYDETGGTLSADYNVAPTTAVPIVRQPPDSDSGPGRTAGRVLSLAHWGFVPFWGKNLRAGARMINARAETVATSRAYGPSFARRRCLVPADGWFEWVRRDGAGKQAYYLTPHDGTTLAFAGIWAPFRRAEEPVLTCSVLTTAAIGELARVHERMPLLLPARRWSDWLAGAGDPVELLAPPDPELVAGIEIRPVGAAVGNVRNGGPGLIARATEPTTDDRAASTLF